MWEILNEAVQDCLTKSHYKIYIAINNIDRIDLIKGIFDKIIEEKKLQNFITQYRANLNQCVIQFNNCSQIEISTCNENRRGCRVHTLIVDADIDYNIVRTVLYTYKIPYHYWNYQTANIYDNPKHYEVKFFSITTEKGAEIICPIKIQ